MWDKLKRWLKSDAAPRAAETPAAPEPPPPVAAPTELPPPPAAEKSADGKPVIPLMPAEKSPWGVPLLDVRPITLTMISTSTNPHCAKNAVSFGGDDGTSFIGQPTFSRRVIPAELSFRRDPLLADGALFLPEAMEHKWALFHHGGRILCVRSWQRAVFVTAEVRQAGESITISAIEGTFSGEDEPLEFTIAMLDFLLRTHALGIIYPVPLPAGLFENPYQAAMWCFSVFGNRAFFATDGPIPRTVPDKPLRSHSLLHIATARGDTAGIDIQLNAGVPVDLLAGDGLTPLHWALTTEGTAVLAHLLSRGAGVDSRSAEGATPLMNAVQGNAPETVEFLLAHGAAVNAQDGRGFTALHRAAEMGHAKLVQLLLAKGAARDITAAGHTPLSLARKQNHADIVRLLEPAL